MPIYYLPLLLLTFLFALPTLAQVDVKPTPSEKTKKPLLKAPHKREFFNNVEVGFAYTLIPSNELFEETTVAIPTISVAYEHWFYKRIGVIFMAELELGRYIVEFDNREFIRKNLVEIFLGIAVEPVNRLVFIGGLGNETDQEENFPVIRFGVIYDFPIAHRWAIEPAVYFDYKYAYYTIGFEVGVGYWFGHEPVGDFLKR